MHTTIASHSLCLAHVCNCAPSDRVEQSKMADQNKEMYDRCHAAKYSNKAVKEAIDAGLDVNWVSSRFGMSLFL